MTQKTIDRIFFWIMGFITAYCLTVAYFNWGKTEAEEKAEKAETIFIVDTNLQRKAVTQEQKRIQKLKQQP